MNKEPFKLKSLRIDLETYGDDKGKYKGKISFTSELADIELQVAPEVADKLLNDCATMLSSTSMNLAVELERLLRASIQKAALSSNQIKL